jgi:hypothetical protein
MTTRVDPGSQLIELPRFLCNEPSPQSELTRVPVFIIGMVCGAVVLGGLAFVARDAVLPLIGGIAGRVSTSREGVPAPKIGPVMTINAVDDQKFQIRWHTGSLVIKEARSAVLAIVDGGPPQRIPLDGPQLGAGMFTYKEPGARVDARLTIVTAEGGFVEAATTFLGLPAMAEGERVLANTGAAALARQKTQLRRQLDEQIAQNKTLQAQLDRLRQRHAVDTAP